MKHNIALLLFLSFTLISCAAEETGTSLPDKDLNDNWSSSAISAELTVTQRGEVLGLQLTGTISGDLDLPVGGLLLTRTLDTNPKCYCGTSFTGDNSSGSFTIKLCQSGGGSGDQSACNALNTTGSYEIKSNQLNLTPSSGPVMIFL